MESKHILFPFDKDRLSAGETKKIERAFKKGGADVLEVEVEQKTSRTAGIMNRKIHISFTDSQRVTMLVKESGDVYQVMVNGKRVPMKEQDDHAAAIVEIAARLDAGRTAFQKRLAKIKAPKPKGVKATPRRSAKAVLARSKALKEELADVRAEIDAIKAELGDSEGSDEQPAKEYTYRLFKKDDFQYQIKSGRKVIDKLIKVTGGWHLGGKIFETIERAVAYFEESRSEFLGMASEVNPTVTVTGVAEAQAGNAA